MAAPDTWSLLRYCFFGDGRSSLTDRVAILGAWCLALVIVFFNALFGLLFEDGNLLIRGVGTLVLATPLLWLLARRKRSLQNRTTPPR